MRQAICSCLNEKIESLQQLIERLEEDCKLLAMEDEDLEQEYRQLINRQLQDQIETEIRKDIICNEAIDPSKIQLLFECHFQELQTQLDNCIMYHYDAEKGQEKLLNMIKNNHDMTCCFCLEDCTGSMLDQTLCFPAMLKKKSKCWNHVFHSKCIHAWLSLGNACPSCRR